jgi:polyferredoxin
LGKLSERDNLLIWIVVWEFLYAAIALILVYIVVYESYLEPEDPPPFAVSVAFIVILVAYFSLSMAAGVGLFMRKQWGRIVAIIQAALSLLNIPIGTVIGALILVYMLKPQTKEYFKAVTE